MNAAINEAKVILNNKIIMKFLRAEALAKVAADMNAEGSSITAKGVELGSYNRFSEQSRLIRDRIDHYVAAGVVGCLMAQAGA